MEVLIAFLALVFLTMGLMGRTSMMQQNACQMTFTSMEKTFIEVESSVPGVGELYRHPSKGNLNKQPVLFIPGAQGKADQVRSLSSPMHNDDNYFQYFAIDFKNKESSAVHGAGLLAQAAFVNDAIRTILEIYKSDSESIHDKKDPSVKVMLVGHSLGGMIARTSVMLSNYPMTNANFDHSLTAVCPVSDIIMLSTPNKAPPYSTDGSIQAVYNSVNKGWLMSHYNTSNDCTSSQTVLEVAALAASDRRTALKASKDKASKEKTPLDQVCPFTNNTRLHTTVKMNTACSVCAPHIRLLSISGGELDNLVPASLTSLENLTPRARNLTYDHNAERTLTGRVVTKGEEGIMGTIARGLGLKWTYGLLKSLIKMSNPLNMIELGKHTINSITNKVKSITSSTTPESEHESTEKEKEKEKDSEEVIPESIEIPDYSNYTYGHLIQYNQDHWDQHIVPYIDSQHYSIRSQQLKACGFVVDHLAVVWCRQLIHSISNAMRVLARNPSDLNDPRITEGEKNLENSSISKKSSKANTDSDTRIYTDKKGRINWKQLLPHKTNSTTGKFLYSNIKEAEFMIPSVASFHLKNISYNAFNNYAPIDELKYMKTKLSYGSIQSLSVWYISNHLATILAFYVFIGIMILAVPIRRRITNWKSHNKKNRSSVPEACDFNSLRMNTHMHLEDFIPLCMTFILPTLAVLLPPIVLKSHFYQNLVTECTPNNDNTKLQSQGFVTDIGIKVIKYLLILFPFVLKIGYYDYYGQDLSGMKLVYEQRHLFAVLTSYGVALTIRTFVTSSVYGVRFIIRCVYGFFYAILYKNLVPKVIRKWIKATKKAITALIPFGIDTFIVIASASVCLMIIFHTNKNRNEIGVVSNGAYAISILTIFTVLASVLYLVRALFFPIASNDAHFQHHQTAAALLYLPMIILCIPSAFYSYYVVVEHPDMFANVYPTFSIFTTERVNFLVASSGIFLHLLQIYSWKVSYTHTGNISGITFLINVLRRPVITYTNKGSIAFSTSASIGNLGNSACCHEDGGRYAVFEEISEEMKPTVKVKVVDAKNENKNDTSTSGSKDVKAPLSTMVSDGVILGSTYKVISCECYKDRKLKDTSQWCDFCKCERCGMKNVPSSYFANKPQSSKSSSWWGGSDENEDDEVVGSTGSIESGLTATYPYSANQLLVAALFYIAIRAVLHYHDKPYQQFCWMGAAAWCFVGRDYLVWAKAMLP